MMVLYLFHEYITIFKHISSGEMVVVTFKTIF
jgi:hypothetical protein